MEQYYFEHSGYYFDKDPLDSERYIMLTCAKNEEDYIVEWIEHHLSLGFDKIIIADNNDIGNDSLHSLLKDYVDGGKVQIFDCRGNEAIQVGLYADFCRESNFKWCAFYDCDEFLEIGAYPDIKSYLAQFDGYDVVLLNWLVFGPCGQLEKKEGGVQERFKTPQAPILYFKENSFIKSIVRGGNKEKFGTCWFNGSHVPYDDDSKGIRYTLAGYYEPKVLGHAYFQPRYKNGYIKHYYTKSFEEWIKKAGRGWPDGTENLVLSKYMIFKEGLLPDIDFMSDAVFKRDDYDAGEAFKVELDAYDVINIRTSGEFTYPLFTEIMDVFKHVTDHTFIVSDDVIDDTLFTIILEYGYATGNRVLYCKNDAEIWMAYEKYHKKNCTYYIITFS